MGGSGLTFSAIYGFSKFCPAFWNSLIVPNEFPGQKVAKHQVEE